MAKLGFLGLGLMGYPMARNLIKAGHDVALWSNTSAKAGQLVAEAGGTAFATPSEVAAASDCIFICVGNTEMSEKVIFGEHGVLAGAQPKLIVVDVTTVGPSYSREVHEKLTARGIDFLGAPCTGSTPGANNAALTFMIGGEESVFEKVRPYFEVMGKKLYFCGGPGMGLHAKLTQNLVLSNILQAFIEGIVLSTKAGIEPKLMIDILANSAAKSGLIDYKAPFILRRDFQTNFSVKWMHKDIGLALETGQELGVPLFLTSITRQVFQTAISEGFGEDDMCSIVNVLEKMTGIQVTG